MNAIIALLEKAVWTFLEAFAAALMVGPALNASTAQAAAMAGLAAAFTILANGLAAAEVVGLPYRVEVILRVLRTYVAAVLAYLVALPVLDLSYSTLQAAATAGIPALLTVVKGLAASKVGDPASPATLPNRYDPPPIEPAAA